MKFTAKLADIQSAVTLASTAVSDHAILPILNNICISTEATGLSISATDLEKYAVVKCPAEINQSGECLVSAKTFQALLSKIQTEDISFNLDTTKLKIVAGSLKLNIPYLPRGTFPTLPTPQFLSGFSTDSDTLKAIIKNTIFASSKDLAKAVLAGININPTSVIATDGYRMSHMNHTYPISESIIIPNSALKALQTILPTSSTLGVELSKECIQFTTEKCVFQSKLIAGDYPNISTLLIKDNHKTFEVNTKELVNTLELALILSTNELSQHIIFSYADNTLTIKTVDDSINKPISTSTINETFTIAYNAKYLLDYLRIIPDESVTLWLKDDTSAGHLTPKSPLSSYIIMPYRV